MTRRRSKPRSNPTSRSKSRGKSRSKCPKLLTISRFATKPFKNVFGSKSGEDVGIVVGLFGIVDVAIGFVGIELGTTASSTTTTISPLFVDALFVEG